MWADPFPVEHGGKTYIFVEQQIGHDNGTLGYIELYPDLSYAEFIPVLEKPYHLSFPNIFYVKESSGGNWYMIPESHENKTIDLYQAIEFPAKWEYVSTLKSGIKAVDSVVFFHDTKWWLFTSLETELGINNSLYSFYTDNFMASNWMPHPQNPVVKGLENSRMAGTIFIDKTTGSLIRPAQNCKKDYGKEINLNEILEFTTTKYRERIMKTIKSEKKIFAVCTHTINFSENYMLRDIKTRKLRIINKESLL
jgi:hypothetical protein